MDVDKFCYEVYVKYFCFLGIGCTCDSFIVYLQLFGLLSLWSVGILSNVINIVVFSHKNMAHPINLIFRWLSISDLLELLVYELYNWLYGWNRELEDYPSTVLDGPSYNQSVLILFTIYAVQVFHTITVGLNIALAFWRYLAIAHPLVTNKMPCDHRSAKLTIIWLYIICFVSYLPIWYIYHIVVPPSITTGEQNVTSNSVEINAPTYDLEDPIVNFSYFICCVALRIGPFFILFILSALLIYAVVKAGHDREQLDIQTPQMSEEHKKMNQINVTIIVIVLMFLITEIPFGMYGFCFMLKYYSCTEILGVILEVTLVLNSSYNIFCYLITSRNYRETLKLLLDEKCGWVSSVIRQPDVELPWRRRI